VITRSQQKVGCINRLGQHSHFRKHVYRMYVTSVSYAGDFHPLCAILNTTRWLILENFVLRKTGTCCALAYKGSN
jgi:hypothetical protein